MSIALKTDPRISLQTFDYIFSQYVCDLTKLYYLLHILQANRIYQKHAFSVIPHSKIFCGKIFIIILAFLSICLLFLYKNKGLYFFKAFTQIRVKVLF